MEKTEDKGVVESLKDEEVEKISGGADEGKKFTGPKPAFDHPIVTDYGGVRPRLLKKPVTTVLGEYGMAQPIEPGIAYGMKMPRKPGIDPEDKKDTTEE